ncbi:MAG: hypothetical protein IJO45_06390, partial [Oscillospiraceae bacterium]|nr:hypothetical protein [Oscillospiraceae bacterium]
MKVRILCTILVLALCCSLFAVCAYATEASMEYNLSELLEQGKIKPLGRTQTGGNGILGDWSGSGFEMNVSGNGGSLSVGIETSYACTWAVLVDGEQVFWERIPTGTNTISVDVPAGNHKITVIKESEISSIETDYCDLTTLSFGGNIESAPPSKDLLIEFVGDSYTCGHGTLGAYQPAKIWTVYDHSFMHAYPWYVAKELNADYSLAARGGIGLFTGVSTQQGTTNKTTIADIYSYTSGFRKSEGQYDFARQPDVIFIGIGANDGISTTDSATNIDAWKAKLETFVDQIRAKNPDAAIVMWNHRAVKFRAITQIVEERKETDPNLYAFSFSHQGNGSAALYTQFAGHPSAADSESLGKAIAKFLINSGIVPQKEETAHYNDLVYYACENGSDSNDGKTIGTAKNTLYGALTQAKQDNPEFAGDARVVVYVDGVIRNKSTSTQAFADADGTLKTASGKNVPVLVTTYNYSGTKAVVDTAHNPTNAASGIVYFCNDVTMKDITFQATTNEVNGCHDYQIFTGYNQVTFDNVTFAKAGAAPTAHEDYDWQISATQIVGTVELPSGQFTSSVTFKNGDYTDIDVAAVRTNKLYNGTVTSCPGVDAKIIVGKGAQLGTVYNRYGTLSVGSSCVEVHGGSIEQYYGTSDGASGSKKTFAGDINFVMTSGSVEGASFNSAGSYVVINGDINNTVSGGTITIRPTVNYDGIFLAGRNEVTVNNVNNTISGGGLYIQCDTASLDACYYFGGSRNANVKGNVTNKISGGSFIPMNGAYATKSGFYFGQYSGTIAGTLCNEISAGTFDLGANANSVTYMGARNPNSPIGKIVNVFGQKGSDQGPVFYGTNLRLAGGWSQVGVTKAASAEPKASECSDTVVLSNTFYGGLFERFICGSCASATRTDSGYYSFIKGSIENNIYGGQFWSTFMCAGYDAVYGKVTTNIYDGCIGEIFGAGVSAKVYDGVELNIYGLKDNGPVRSTLATINAGSSKSTVPAPQTPGRASVKLTITPEETTTFHTPLRISGAEGKVEVDVSGGTYSKGFSVNGVTVLDALAEGHMPVDASGTVIVPTEAMTSTGTASVTVQKVYYGYTSCADDAQKCYTTDPNASDSKPAHNYENQICTVCGRSENGEVQTHSHECEHCEGANWLPWNGDVQKLYNGGHFYLTNETTMSACMDVQSLVNKAVDVTICLNGQTLKGPASARMFRLSGGAKVTIVDCTAATVAGSYTAGSIKPQFHNIKGVVAGIYSDVSGEPQSGFTLYDGIVDGGGNNNTSAVTSTNVGGGLLDMNSNSKIDLYGGVLKNYTSYYGGAIYIGSGTLTIDGGTIKDCNATRGRAIMIRNSGKAVLESGQILGGASSHGLIVLQNGGTLTVNGGKIGDTEGNNGHGIHINGANSSVTMNGGEISGNANYGVWIDGGTLHMSGGKIHGNMHGVVISSGTFNMTGGEITGNTTVSEGAGVRINGGTCNMSGGKIYGNSSTDSSSGTGGVRVSGTFNMTGGEIYGNSAPASASSQIQTADEAAQISISGAAKVTAGTASKNAVNAFKGIVTVSGGNVSGSVTTGSGGALSITGGVFDTDVTTYVADGYQQYLSGEVGTICTEHTYQNGTCIRCGAEEPVAKFDFAGSTMTLGNELVLNFVYNKALLTGTDNYAKVTIAREGGDYTYEIPQGEWTAFNASLNQIPVKVFAKEMTDEVTVVICNAAGQEVSNPRTGSVVAYCNNLFEKSTVQKDKAMAVDMLNYGAAAQIQFNYREETLANAG